MTDKTCHQNCLFVHTFSFSCTRNFEMDKLFFMCAIQVNIAIMRTFVQLRQMLSTNAELSRKLVAMEKNYDIKFKAIFEAIHQLMTPTDPKKKRAIGFAPWKEK